MVVVQSNLDNQLPQLRLKVLITSWDLINLKANTSLKGCIIHSENERVNSKVSLDTYRIQKIQTFHYVIVHFCFSDSC